QEGQRNRDTKVIAFQCHAPSFDPEPACGEGEIESNSSGKGGKSRAQGIHRGNLTEFWNQIRM
ncbi:MAG: hypothetical protein M3Y50_11040, partial [Acidobacteriota bacterium]|nr:hypothetical protein [Acidobacteriota bacterium]